MNCESWDQASQCKNGGNSHTTKPKWMQISAFESTQNKNTISYFKHAKSTKGHTHRQWIFTVTPKTYILNFFIFIWVNFSDWNGLAELTGFSGVLLPHIQSEGDKTARILDLWYERDGDKATVQQLLNFLEELDRFDIIYDISDLVG